VNQGADPNNCMFAMVYADDLVSAKLLRRHGAHIDEVFHAETPLIYAMRHRRVKFGEWLVSEGANPNFKDGRGFTALHHAVRRRLPDSTLVALIKRGAHTDAVSRDGVSVGQRATRAQKRFLGVDAIDGSSLGRHNSKAPLPPEAT
jgi:ankyrin repeat protein